MAQIQRFKQSRFGQEVWVFGIYLGFGVWNLEFEVNHQGLFPSDLRGSGDIRMNPISSRVFRTIHRIIRRFDKPLQVEVVPVLG
jgi:hypothetical protein